MSVNAIPLSLLSPVYRTPPTTINPSLQTFSEWGVPSAWIDAEFCTEKGYLCFTPTIRTKCISLENLFNQWIEIGYQNVSIRSYFDAVLLAFSDTPCKLYLRGSYATYLLNPCEELREILNNFSQQNPLKSHLIDAGLKAIEPLLPIFHEPDDADWALIWDEPPTEDELLEIKNRLITINASFGNYSADFAEKHTFLNLFKAKINPLTQFADPIVIASLEGKPKLDLVVGLPQIAPYLFTCDDHYIRIGSLCTPEIKPQAIFDACFGIIRAEERHAMDFRALMKAVKHRSQGKKWDESRISFRTIFNGFLDLPTDILTATIDKKIGEGSVEPISFVLNLLSLVDHPSRLQELWEALRGYVTLDPFVTFEEACSGVVLYKEHFQNGIGVIPFAEAKNLYPLKGVLLKHLKEIGPHPLPVFDRAIAHIASQGFLTEEEEKMIAAHFCTDNLFYTLIEKGYCDEAFSFLFKKIQHFSLLQQLETLKHVPGLIKHLQHFLASLQDREQPFLFCLEREILLPNESTKSIFRSLFIGYEGMRLIEWLKKVGSKVKSGEKEWVVDLWIELTQQRKIPLTDFKMAVEAWMNSHIPDRVKTNCFFKILRTFGSNAFTQKAKLHSTSLFADATQEDVENWILDLENPELFIHAHWDRLERGWESLFQKAKARNLVSVLLPFFHRSLLFPQILKISLPSLPAGERLKWIYSIAEPLWEEVAHELPTDEKIHLQLERLRRSHSFFLLCALRRNNVQVPEKLTESVVKRLRQEKNLKGAELLARTRDLVEALQLEELLELIPRLDPLHQEEVKKLIETKIKKSIELADLQSLNILIKNREFQKFVAIAPVWFNQLRISPEQAHSLLEMIKATDLNSPILTALCLAYLPYRKTMEEEIAFANILFSFSPKDLPSPLPDYLLKTVIQDPFPLREQIASHRQWLTDQIQTDEQNVYEFLLLLHKLKTPLPKNIPQSVITLIKKHLSIDEDFSLALSLLESKGAESLQFDVLSAIIRSGNLEDFKTWLQCCLMRLNADEKKELIDQIDPLQSWMEHLLEHLKNSRHPSIKNFMHLFLERYFLKYGHAITVPFTSFIDLPIRRYEIFIPLLHNEDQFQHFLQWLNPKKAELPGVSALFAHLISEYVKRPSPGPLIHSIETVETYLKDQALLKGFAKRALNCYLEEGKGSEKWLKYATDELEVRQSIACAANHVPPIDNGIIHHLFDRSIALSHERPELRFGEDFAIQVYRIIQSYSINVYSTLMESALHLLSVLVNEHEQLAITTRLKLLMEVAKHPGSEISLNAYEQLLAIVGVTPDLNLETLEALAQIMFLYPQIPSTVLLDYLIKQSPEFTTQERRLRYAMLAYLGLACLKNPDTWEDEPSIEYLASCICNTAKKLGNVDVTKAPYIDFFTKTFSVIGRLNPKFVVHYFDEITDIAMKFLNVTEPTQFYNEFVPKFIEHCFKNVAAEDFEALLKSLQLVNVIIMKYYPFDLKSRDFLLISFIKNAIHHKYYKVCKEHSEALVTSMSYLSRIQDRYYYSFFLLDDQNDLEISWKFFKKMSIEESSQRVDLALKRGFLRKDVTGSLIIFNAFQRGVATHLITEKRRKELLHELIPYLKEVMPDTDSALLFFRNIIGRFPKNASKRELQEAYKLMNTLEKTIYDE